MDIRATNAKLPDASEELSRLGPQAIGLNPQETTKFMQSEIAALE